MFNWFENNQFEFQLLNFKQLIFRQQKWKSFTFLKRKILIFLFQLQINIWFKRSYQILNFNLFSIFQWFQLISRKIAFFFFVTKEIWDTFFRLHTFNKNQLTNTKSHWFTSKLSICHFFCHHTLTYTIGNWKTSNVIWRSIRTSRNTWSCTTSLTINCSWKQQNNQ